MISINSFILFFGFKSYLRDERGVSAIEAAMLFPVLFSMLMAIYDLGQGVVINQKTVAASQVIADLISRSEVVDTDLIDDIVIGGKLALEPYDKTPFGYDIASIEFDEDGDPIVLWRVTDNMDENENAIDSTIGLGEEGEGVIAVSVVYAYEPFFTNFVVDSFDMTEVAFLRGRKSTTVTCSDCP
jgi:Flp pilus assembly protein TadG